MKKRITSTLLLFCAVLFLLTLLPVTAQAETEGDWEYTVNSGLATVTKYNGTDAEVTVPEFVENGLYRVTAIGSSAFANNVTMTAVNFPKSLTGIGEKAFEGCVGLTEITLPEKLTRLGSYAFLGCTKLTKITVLSTALEDNQPIKNKYGDLLGYDQPFYSAGTAGDGIEVVFADGCTRVPANMFYAYSGSDAAANITSVTIADSVTEIGTNAFRGCTAIGNINLGSVVTIGASAFQSCTSLTGFVWSEELTTIGGSAFADCTKMAEAILPKSVTTIHAGAFSGCTKLSIISLPKGLTTIGEKALVNCVSLTELILPEKLTTLGPRAFESCTKLTKITVLSTTLHDNQPIKNKYGDLLDYDQPFYSAGTAGDGIELIFADGCTRVPANMFYAYSGSNTAANITSVTLADSVTEIGAKAFFNCVDLKAVHFGKVVTIGAEAFRGCTALTDFNWSEKLTTIGSSAFLDCTKLETLALPKSLTTIESSAFSGCTALTSVTFPKGLTKIAEKAFAGCTDLPEVTLPEKLTTLGPRSFEGCTELSKITVLCTTLGDNQPIKNRYGDLLDYDQPFYSAGTAGDGIEVIFADGCTRVPANMFYAYSGSDAAANLKSVTIADSVTEIGENAFRDCADLPDVVIGNGMETIGTAAFQGCKELKNIDFGSSVTSIGNNAFAGCTALPKVTFPESLTKIGNYAFQECSALKDISFPSSLTTIGEGAFKNCTAIVELRLPEKLTTLSAYAFESCTHLNKITVLCTSLGDSQPIKNRYGDLLDYEQPFRSAGTAGDGIKVIFADGCTRVPANMFYAYSGSDTAANLKSVTIADTVTEIGENAFRDCADLSGVVIGNGMKTVGNSAFQGCKALTDFDFGTSVTKIGSYSFCECSALKDISFPGSLTTIGEGAFKNCTAIVELTLPKKLTNLGAYAFQGCTHLNKITVLCTALGDSQPIKNRYGDLLDYEQPFHSAGTAGSGITVIFADGCTRIPANLFYAYSGVETAPTITSILVADTVTEVGSNAFTNCGDLKTLRFMGSNPAIADNAFTGVVANGYHPGWPDTALLDYGGDITWELWDAVCDHAYTELRNAQAATCTEDGYTGDTVCVVCGEILATGEMVLAAGHTWDDGEVTLEPTPTEPGEMTYTCQSCGETKTEVIGATACDHTDTELQNEKAATCAEEGYTGDMVCTACGEIIEPGEPIPVTDHVTELQNEKEATCFEEGYTGDTVCTVCGTVTASGEAIAMVDHSWDAGEVTREPTATEPGEMTFTCTTQGCGETRTEEIAPSACAHNNTELKNAVEATCTQEGYTGDTICTDCGETVLTGEVIPVKDHIEVIDKAVEPTCKETGLTEGKHCEVCGEVLVKQETVDKLPHKFEGGSCTDCGEEDPDWEEPSEPTEPSDPTEPTDPSEPDDDIVPPVNPNVIRIAGTNRFETAFKVADQMKENLGLEKFDAIIVASGTNFPDALSGSYLAAVKRAPILLSFNEAYNDQAKNYIRENLAADGTVYLLGSMDVVPETFEEDLEGFNVKRLAGPNRFDTNLEILKEVGVEGKEILVCSGLGFADSLSASATELPILLVWNNLFENQKAFLEEYASGGKFCIIGGETAVSKQIERQIGQYGQTRRVGGANRFMTSVMIAETFFDAPASAVLAYAWNYPDGLCGGALASTMDAPLILTMTKYENAAAGYIQSEGIDKGAVLGGTGLISEESVVTIFGEAKVEEVDPALDTDGDKVPDVVEMEFGSSPNSVDTDEDGLNDYTEIYETDTDPCLADTDVNGIPDKDEDYDEDGLTNKEEQDLGTSSSLVDTDGDKLNDYDEAKVHGTNPLNQDTDSDTLTDAEEITLGLDPLKGSTDGTTPDAERTFVQITDESVMDEVLVSSDSWLRPSVSGDVPGVISNNIALCESSVDSFDSDRSVVSDVIDMYTDYETEVTLSFAYDGDYTGSMKDLSVVTYGEDGLSLVDTEIDESVRKISAEVSESGTYFVLDLNEFLKGLGIDVLGNISDGTDTPETIEAPAAETVYYYSNAGQIIRTVEPEDQPAIVTCARKQPTYWAAAAKGGAGAATGKADVVFVIDTTGSMSGAISGVRRNISAFSRELVNNYNIDANFALIEYRDINYDGADSTVLHKNVFSNWYTNVDTFINEVDSLDVDGGGDTPETPIEALEMARRLDWRGDAVKFVILVTDAGYHNYNSYGIADMEEMSDRLLKDGIITSAIAEAEYVYESLTKPSEGLFGYVYGDFSEILLQLADKVGEITNADGEWVFLDDFQAVKLSDTLENAATNDTDDDGYSDAKELGESKEVNMMHYIERVLNKREIPVESYTGKTTLTVWQYISNPTLVDTDYDGISDGPKDYDKSKVTPDSNPRRGKGLQGLFSNGNFFSGSTSANGFDFDISFRMDYTKLFSNVDDYQRDLSKMGIIYSIGAYHNDVNITKGTTVNGEDDALLKAFGMKNVQRYKLANEYTDDDISEAYIGHREVTYQGTTKDIIVVAVRGTDATIEEWSSNFDVGANTPDYWDQGNPDWVNKNHHKGFEVAANRLYKKINAYIAGLSGDTPKLLYFTGHSRGAAIANILASQYVDDGYATVAYTFATPNTTLETSTVSDYNTIFNIVNADDLVPYLPLDDWGFDKYGKTYSVSIKDSYEDKGGKYGDETWEAMFGCDYNFNGTLNGTLKAFSKAVTSREAIYEFTGADNTKYTYDQKYSSKAKAEEACDVLMDRYGARINRFVKVSVTTHDPVIGDTKYQVTSEQTPAAMMMILTDVVASKCHTRTEDGKDQIEKYKQLGAGEDTFYGQDVGFYVAKRYENAKEKFIKSGSDSASDLAMNIRMGGMLHSHMSPTYYLIADDAKELIP